MREIEKIDDYRLKALYMTIRKKLEERLRADKSLKGFFQIEGAMLNRHDFVSVLDREKFASQDDSISLAAIIYSSHNEVNISLIEDFAIGFGQNACKVFLFGRADQRLFAFSKTKRKVTAG